MLDMVTTFATKHAHGIRKSWEGRWKPDGPSIDEHITFSASAEAVVVFDSDNHSNGMEHNSPVSQDWFAMLETGVRIVWLDQYIIKGKFFPEELSNSARAYGESHPQEVAARRREAFPLLERARIA